MHGQDRLPEDKRETAAVHAKRPVTARTIKA
jgi:hypothetical protein